MPDDLRDVPPSSCNHLPGLLRPIAMACTGVLTYTEPIVTANAFPVFCVTMLPYRLFLRWLSASPSLDLVFFWWRSLLANRDNH